MIYLQAFLFLAVIFSLVYYLLCLFFMRSFFKKAPEVDPGFTPPVSILKSMKGLDFQAEEHLSAFCRQYYPQYQVIFGFLDTKDPAIPVAESVRKAHPDSDVELVVAGQPLCPNPKVSNLRHMLEKAKYEVVAISDSDMRVGPDYLTQVVAPLKQLLSCQEEPTTPGATGLVTCPYRGLASGTLASSLEALNINASFIPSVVLAQRLARLNAAFGSTIVTTRKVLREAGGLEAIGSYLADDYHLAFRVTKAGYGVCLSSYIVDNGIARTKFKEMFLRRLRWARTIKSCQPWGYVGTFFTQGTALSLFFLAAASFSKPAWAVVLVTMGIRLATAWHMAHTYLRCSSFYQQLWLLPLSDLLDFVIWAVSFTENKVVWRGQKYRILKGGRLAPL